MSTSYKTSLSLILGLSAAILAAPSHAVTQRNAYAQVLNESSKTIEWIAVQHKYSNNYREHKVWRTVKPRARTRGSLRVKYNTGFGTTGKDWWRVVWKYKGDSRICVTNPNNFRSFFDRFDRVAARITSGTPVGDALFNTEPTKGFKQHILRSSDANRSVTLTVYNRNRLSISSPSGNSWTVFKCR